MLLFSTSSLRLGVWWAISQGVSSQFPGVLVGTPHVRKCHQMSSKEHIQLGWVVRWVLSTPPGHPAARRCVRVVPVLPLLLCTRPARARPSVGGQSPTPAPRQLPWSPPRGPERTVRLIGFSSSRQPVCISSHMAPNRDREERCIAPAWCCCGRAARFTLEPRDAPWVM